ncbi:MAG: hypothetical protein ACTHOI_04915 [Sphingomicrobium sp.]
MPTTELDALIAELDNWPAADPATFWWRDDDAVGPSDALDRLLEVSGGRPLALATVPFEATSALATRLQTQKHVAIFQHGWKHQNHAAEGPNSEYPAGRSLREVAQELAEGRTKLTGLFGPRFAPVFTPPWHGFDASYVPLLETAGLRALSVKGRRPHPTSGAVPQNNVHCVPILWADPPGFGDPGRYTGQLVQHLEQRRAGRDRAEATGILTHHLVQTPESLDFVRGVLDVITMHPSARLVDPVELFFGR